MNKATLDVDEILGPRDEQLLRILEGKPTAIPDEVVTYLLERVGCATTDQAATRLVAAAAQVAFEKALEEVRFLREGVSRVSLRGGTYTSGTANDGSQMARDGSSKEAAEIDGESLYKALLKHATVTEGPCLDVLLDPVADPSGTPHQERQGESSSIATDN